MANIEIFGTLVRNDSGTNRDKIVQGSQVEGGYFVCETLPTQGTWATGQLCFCTGTEASPNNKFYQYNGTGWVEKEFGVNKSVTFAANGGAAAGTSFNGSAAVTVDYATVGAAPSSHTHDYTHTHEVNIVADNTSTNELTLAHNTKYKLTAGGQNFVFTMPSDTNTWRPLGTGKTDAAAGNHTHDGSYYTKDEVDGIINTAVSSVLVYKGTRSKTSDLPTSDNVTGDVWNITNACAASDNLPAVNAGDNVAWNGNSWDVLAGTVDLSGYYTKSDVYTKTEIDSGLNTLSTTLSNSIPTLYKKEGTTTTTCKTVTFEFDESTSTLNIKTE